MGRFIGTRQRAIVSALIAIVLIVAIAATAVALSGGSHPHPAAAASNPSTTTSVSASSTRASTSSSTSSTSTTMPKPTTTTTVRRHKAPPVTLPPVTVPQPPPVTPKHCLPGGDPSDGNTPQLAELPQALQDQIKKMAKWAQQFPTASDAEKAGFARVTTDMCGMGSHYVNVSLLSDTFDANKVAGLQYNNEGKLVAFNYLVWSCGHPPEGFAGKADVWHQHSNICIGSSGEVISGSGSVPMTEAECKARGGVRIVDLSALWMLHVWAIPGWESPNGVFSHDNPNVT